MKHPNRIYAALLSAAAAVAGAAPAHALLTARSVPPASFLDYHVDTVPQLTFEVTYDKTVQARLAHHFHLTGPAMSAYVRDNLVLQHLPAPLRTRVYCVSPRGREYFVLMTLKTGTPVFAMRRTGQPILRLVCGNPLVAALPPVPKKALAAKPAAKALTKVLVKPLPTAQVSPALESADVTPTVAPVAWSVPTITASDAGEVLFTQGASSASGAGWLALLPALGGLVGVFDAHGDSGGGTAGGGGAQDISQPFAGVHTTLIPSGGKSGGFVPNGPPSGPGPVPEPGPMCVFALGGLMLGALRLRRK